VQVHERAPEPEPEAAPEPVQQTQEEHTEHEVEFVPARPRFAEIAEAPLYAPLPRDYAEYDSNQVHSPYEERRPQPEATLFSEPDEETLRELDKPAFMRRLSF
jgi:hypothetical protein